MAPWNTRSLCVSFPGMLAPLFLLLVVLTGGPSAAPEPHLGAAASLREEVAASAPADSPTKWIPAPMDDGHRADPSRQLLYSSLGAGLGIAGGSLLGVLIGSRMVSSSDNFGDALGKFILSLGAGYLVGGTTGATWGASNARPDGSSRSLVPTALGGFGGLALGLLAGSAVLGASASDASQGTAFLCLWIVPAFGAGAGATLADQWSAPTNRRDAAGSAPPVAVAAWIPGPGWIGLRASVPVGF